MTWTWTRTWMSDVDTEAAVILRMRVRVLDCQAVTTGSIMAMAQNLVLFVKKSCIPSPLEHFITVHQCKIGLDVDHSQTLDHLLTQR